VEIESRVRARLD